MKKILIIICALFISVVAFSQENNEQQTVDQQIKYTNYIYCELLGKSKFLSSKVSVDIDFGQSVSFWTPDRRYKDENGKSVNFNSMVDAMNFMGSVGWEFVQAYVVTVGNENVYHWLLKMELKE